LITTLRIIFGFCTLAFVPATRRRIERSDWPRLALLGTTWVAIPLSMFPLAERHVSSAVTGMLNGATPLFTAFVATLMLGKLPPRQQLVGLGIGFVGVLLIGLASVGEKSSSFGGIVLILVALCSYGLAYNIAVPLYQRYGALPVIWRALAVGFTLTLPLGLIGLADSSFAWRPLFACMALGALGTGVAYVAMGTLTGRVGSTRASITTYLIPVVAIILGAVFRNDHIAPLAVVGTAIVLSGAWITGRSRAS
ncbi:MAG TPA: DMT family transporter, partial [Acidimicrobiales bacterium]|nr:DMT family transporter [Acidimicrobiales bacterium]